ncbi:MAG: glutathione S-transferase family protein [Alphaproteobacteria bacterium]|nr:glutathione S-transferase family protein [Alphaproteobacteria bacterium]MBF0251053.1 glutathione S-transferase family protein [Alphaproteobacteria bacterium]
MRTLYHLWLSPSSRKVRIVLSEKKLDAELVVEKTWERREGFLRLNPAGETPVLVESDGMAISGGQVICEYLDERVKEPPLLGKHPIERAEVRRLCQWFDEKFNAEVTRNLVEEKVMKRFLGLGSPDSAAIRAGKANIGMHLDYVGYLVDRRSWLAGEQFTLADITAAAHLSCVDYLGDVPWAAYPSAKDWYARIKSRPSFRALLHDLIPGVPPPPHYHDLDF